MSCRREIDVLNELVRATCHSAERCAVAGRAAQGYRRMVLDQMCTDRRLLLVDLIRCLLLRGMAVPEVKKAITAVPAQPVMVAGVDVVWIDVEIAERKLHLALRKALADVEISEAVQELLSIHYLRLRLHHDELDGIQEGSLPLEAAKSGMPTSNAYSA